MEKLSSLSARLANINYDMDDGKRRERSHPSYARFASTSVRTLVCQIHFFYDFLGLRPETLTLAKELSIFLAFSAGISEAFMIACAVGSLAMLSIEK